MNKEGKKWNAERGQLFISGLIRVPVWQVQWCCHQNAEHFSLSSGWFDKRGHVCLLQDDRLYHILLLSLSELEFVFLPAHQLGTGRWRNLSSFDIWGKCCKYVSMSSLPAYRTVWMWRFMHGSVRRGWIYNSSVWVFGPAVMCRCVVVGCVV